MPRQTRKALELVTKAAEGLTFDFGGHRSVRRRYTVGPKCPENDGQWICVTCGEGFDNQMQKDGHIRDGRRHVLAWNCWSHGPEVP